MLIAKLPFFLDLLVVVCIVWLDSILKEKVVISLAPVLLAYCAMKSEGSSRKSVCEAVELWNGLMVDDE